MAISSCLSETGKVTESDYRQMIEYVRCKEYSMGLKDALLLMSDSASLNEANKKLMMIIEWTEMMRLSLIKESFGL